MSEPLFAHASEAELARILDYYEITWEYEARAFPIRWTLDGRVAESFTPDFYLPGLDLYVELTTLKQSLVRKKNRKLRRLRELYPDVRVKLFYARDFRALMLKYGRIGLLDSLSGAEGQALAGRVDAPAGGRPGEALHVDPAGIAPPGDEALVGGRPGGPARGAEGSAVPAGLAPGDAPAVRTRRRRRRTSGASA